MNNAVTTPFGVAILDIHDGNWALWQVSVDSSKGSLRAVATNAVVSAGFNEKAFCGITGDRQLLLTARAEAKCTEPMVFDAPRFSPVEFLETCNGWVAVLEGLFQAENQRRSDYNAVKVQERKDARASGAPAVEYKRKSPLQGIDWPAPPLSANWESDIECNAPVVGEALRVANGCVRLLNYWLDIELNRTRRNRTYFNGVGGQNFRAWPVKVKDDFYV